MKYFYKSLFDEKKLRKILISLAIMKMTRSIKRSINYLKEDFKQISLALCTYINIFRLHTHIKSKWTQSYNFLKQKHQ